MGFTPCKSDHDLLVRDMGYNWEYVAVMVDDILFIIQNPDMIIEPLKEILQKELKGLRVPKYYSGADVEYDIKCKWWTIYTKTYIKTACEKVEEIFNIKQKSYRSPMETGYQPDMDKSNLLGQ